MRRVPTKAATAKKRPHLCDLAKARRFNVREGVSKYLFFPSATMPVNRYPTCLSLDVNLFPFIPARPLLGGLGNRIHLQSNRGLRQQSAVDRCSRVHGDIGFAQDDAFEVGIRSKSYCASDLPDDVLGQGTLGQDHPRAIGLVQRSRHLEDPSIVPAAREGDIRANHKSRSPFVEARLES